MIIRLDISAGWFMPATPACFPGGLRLIVGAPPAFRLRIIPDHTDYFLHFNARANTWSDTRMGGLWNAAKTHCTEALSSD